jgi:flagellar assembly protein FliH
LSEIITLAQRPRAVRVTGSGPVRHDLPEIASAGVGRAGEGGQAAAGDEAAAGPLNATLEQRLEAEYRRGREEGEARARAGIQEDYERRLEAERSELKGLFEQMRLELERLYARLEKDAHVFALAVAERVIKREVSLDTTTILRQTAEALRMVVGVESVTVRVNPIDAALLRDRRHELNTSADSLRECIIDTDEKIQPGGCIIDTPSGTIDARISTQLKQIETMLFSVSGEGQGNRP